jgi:hypothetical protein
MLTIRVDLELWGQWGLSDDFVLSTPSGFEVIALPDAAAILIHTILNKFAKHKSLDNPTLSIRI